MKLTSLITTPILLALGLSTANAAIVAYSDTFTGTAPFGFTSIGTTVTSISKTTNNRDSTGGDGVAADGALYFNSVNSVAGDEAIAFTFSGTMVEGEAYTLSIDTYNPVNSFNSYRVQLYNLTDNTVLADTGNYGQNGGDIGTVNRTLNYTALAADIGDQLQMRMVENHNNSARDVAIDQFSLGVVAVPEPSSSALLGLAGLGLILRRKR